MTNKHGGRWREERRLEGGRALWDVLKHKLGREHQSRHPGNLQCIVVIRRAPVEHDAQGENLQNTTGNNKTPKHGFNLVDMRAHPSVAGGADLIIIVPNLCLGPYPAVSQSTGSPSVRKISVSRSPLGPSDLTVSQQVAAPLGADSS